MCGRRKALTRVTRAASRRVTAQGCKRVCELMAAAYISPMGASNQWIRKRSLAFRSFGSRISSAAPVNQPVDSIN